MNYSSASEESLPRARLPQVGEGGEPADPTAFETSSPLSEAADQDHSVVASSYDISQASEVGSIPQTEDANSESRDSDVSNDTDVILDELERLREVLAVRERELDSVKTSVRDQQLRIQDLERENQNHEERIRFLDIQGHKLRSGLEHMVRKSKELHKKDKMNQNAQKREFASLARIGEEALE